MDALLLPNVDLNAISTTITLGYRDSHLRPYLHQATLMRRPAMPAVYHYAPGSRRELARGDLLTGGK